MTNATTLTQGLVTNMAANHCFVVLAYGDCPYLDDCLQSLRLQNASSCILITTSTASAFIQSAASRHGVDVLVNPVRAGIASDWNFGLRATRARYVTLAHQDDIYAPTFLERTLEVFGKHGGALCFTGYEEINGTGQVTSSKISNVKHLIEQVTIGRREVVDHWRLRAFLSFGNPLPCSSVTIDRECLPGFDFSDDFASNLDWDAWLRLLESRKTFLHIRARLVYRRHHQLTATSQLILDGRRQREDLVMFRRLWPRPFSDVIAFAYRIGY